MNKQDFLAKLQKGLSHLTEEEREGRLSFYGEMIDDRVEEGLTEEEAVAEIGSIDSVIAQTYTEAEPAPEKTAEVSNKRRMKAWEIVLLILGSPVWVPLLIAAIAVMLSLYAVLWSLVISLWAVFASVAACVIGGLAGGTIIAISGNVTTGIALIGAGIACAGLSIFLFFGCLFATKGSVWLTKAPMIGLVKGNGRKGELQK